MPAACGGCSGISLVIKVLVFRSPKVSAASVGWIGRPGFGGRDIYAGRACFLTLLEGLTFEGGVGETIVVAAGPLGATLFALDIGGVDQPPLLGPLGCAGMGLVVSDVLRGERMKTRSGAQTGKNGPGYKSCGRGLWGGMRAGSNDETRGVTWYIAANGEQEVDPKVLAYAEASSDGWRRR